jgi:hypothetical protein
MKAWIRRNDTYVRKALNQTPSKAHRALRHAVTQAMTADKAIGWYRHSGYM